MRPSPPKLLPPKSSPPKSTATNSPRLRLRQGLRKGLRQGVSSRILALLLIGLLFRRAQSRVSLLWEESQERTSGHASQGCTPGGRCSALPGTELVAGFDEGVQLEVERAYPGEYNFRGFNPSMAAHSGGTYYSVRAANFTLCPHYAGLHAHINHTKPPYGSQVLLCQADAHMVPGRCLELPIDFAAIRRPPPAEGSRVLPFSVRNGGVEDGRIFSWQGRLHIIGTVHVDRSPRRAEPRLVLFRLNQTATGIEVATVLECPGLRGAQKNYMPLVVDGSLYLVIQPQPLIVGWVDPVSLECTVVQSEVQGEPNLYEVLPTSSNLSGGTPFMPLPEPGKFISLVHHYVYKGRRVYVHHFLVISVLGDTAGQHRFEIDWLSEPFRLPRRKDRDFGTQFANGALLRDTSLYITYGISDCFSALAEVKDFHSKLQQWREEGIHGQAGARREARLCPWPQPGETGEEQAISAAYKCCRGPVKGDMPVPHLSSQHQWRSPKARPEWSVTVVTQLSIERLYMLTSLCQTWPDPVAAAVYVPTVSGRIVSDNITLDGSHIAEAELRCAAAVQRMHADGKCIVDLELVTENFDSRQEAELYPFNAMRNRALMLAQTEALLLLDADFLPTPSMVPDYKTLQGHSNLMELLNQPRAIVLPAFEAASAVENKLALAMEAVQSGKEFVVGEFQAGRLVGFHLGLRWQSGQNATEYERWVAESLPYQIRHTTGYEPYILISRQFVPWYDERFRGYGWDKIQHLDHLAALGVPFWVHPTAYVVHRPHHKAPTYNTTFVSGQREKLRDLFSEVHTANGRHRFAPVVSFPELCGTDFRHPKPSPSSPRPGRRRLALPV